MTVKNLIEELEKWPKDMPVTINDCMEYTEVFYTTIELKKKQYIGFPFTENDKFEYINLEIKDKEYWNDRSRNLFKFCH